MMHTVISLMELFFISAYCLTAVNAEYVLMDKLPDLIPKLSYSKLASAEYKRSPGVMLIDMGHAEGSTELLFRIFIALFRISSITHNLLSQHLSYTSLYFL